MRVLLRDLTPSTNYALQLRSVSDGNLSEWSRIFYVLTDLDGIAPKTPTGFAGTMSGTSFKYEWNAVTLSSDETPAWDLTHYEVTITSSGSTASSVFITKDNKFELSFEQNATVFTTPQANVQASVKAVDQAGNKSAATSTVSLTNVAPAQPANFVASALQDTINLKWDAVADLDLKEYRVYANGSAGFTPGPANMVYKGAVTSFIHFNITYGSDTYYKLAAVDVFGTPSTYAATGAMRPISPFLADTTAPAVPTGLAAVLTTSEATLITSAAVSWTAVADPSNDLASYILGYRPVGATDWQYATIDYTNVTTKIDKLTPYVNYEFRIRASDWSANLSAWSATVTTTTTAVDVAPSQPSAPTAVSNTLRVQVTQPFTKQAGGALEPDVISFNVYASTTTGFTPADANKVGVIPVSATNVGTFYLPASSSTPAATTETWYIKTIAVDRGNFSSPASNQVASAPGLIASVNIIDATITSAKISNLVADKITAGAGIITNLDVHSSLTLGSASTTGVIKSYGYVAGTTGFSLDKTLLEINQGSIAAAALKIQQGQNLVPVQYADFEFTPSYYVAGSTGVTLWTSNSPTTVAVGTTAPRFNKQYLSCSWAGAMGANPFVYLGTAITDYNIPVEASTEYIISVYARATGSVATNLILSGRWSDTVVMSPVPVNVVLPASSSTWVRYSGVVTSAATATGLILYALSATLTAGAGFEIDGIQVERKLAALNTPSSWSPPSNTSIDGGYIRTGEIRSNATVTVNSISQPAWSINMAGGASFGNANVRGSIIVGAAGGDVDAGQSYIASGNFVTGTTGWKIDSAGNAEFSTGTFRGSLVGNTMTGGTITGGVLRTDETGSRFEVDHDGARLYDSANLLVVNLPTDAGLAASFSGEILATGLTVNDNLAIRGTSNEFSAASSTKLEAGVTAPSLSPTAAIDWPSVALAAGYPTYGTHWDGTNYHIFDGASTVKVYSPAGALVSTRGLSGHSEGGYGLQGFTKIGAFYYSSSYDGLWDERTVYKFSDSTGVVSASWVASGLSYDAPVMGTDGTYILVVEGGTTNVTIRRYSITGTAQTSLTCSTAPSPTFTNSNSVIVSSADFGASRYIIAAKDNAYVYSLSGTTLTALPNDSFPLPNTATQGLSWDTTNTCFRVIASGKIYQLTANKWTTESALWWASYAWNQTGRAVTDGVLNSTITVTSATAAFVEADDVGRTVVGTGIPALAKIATVVNSTTITLTAAATATASGVTLTFGTFETKQGPKASFTMKKRARATITVGVIPTGMTPNINSAIVFLGRNATTPIDANMYHTTGVPPINTRVFTYLTHTFSGGTTPLATGTFPAGTPAILQSASGGFIVKGDGTGAWPAMENVFQVQPIGAANLDGYTSTGKYQQNANANATLALMYPETKAGLLEINSAVSPGFVWQKYTTYREGGNDVWIRAWHASVWGAWEKLAKAPVWTAYTPTWTAVTTNPTLGNGSISGRWTRVGDKVTIKVLLTAGSTTTFGSGQYWFSFPSGLTPLTTPFDYGSGITLTSGTTVFPIVPVASASGISVYGANSLTNNTILLLGNGGVGGSAWTSTTTIRFSITYEV